MANIRWHKYVYSSIVEKYMYGLDIVYDIKYGI